MEEFEEVVKKIVEETGKTNTEVLEMIYKKQEEYNNLISDVGAAYLVAKEFGIDVKSTANFTKEIKIKDLFGGLNSIRLKVKVLKIFPINTFKKEDGEGRVMNILVGDETGTARLVLWNEQIDDFKFKEGSSIEIINAYTKERNGMTEIRIGMYGIIREYDGEIEVKDTSIPKEYVEKKIAEMVFPEENIKVNAYIQKIFYKNPIIYYCRECSKVYETETCKDHGKINPIIVISGIMEDETSNIVFNMFTRTVESFLNTNKEEIIKLIENKGYDEFYKILENMLDIKYEIKGTTKETQKKNIEINVSYIKPINDEKYVGEKISQLKNSGGVSDV